MTVHLYVPKGSTRTERVSGEGGQDDYLPYPGLKPRDVTIDTPIDIIKVTWHDFFWLETHKLAPGLYEGEGFSVEIFIELSAKGYGKNQTTERKASIKGTFTSFEIAKAFEHELFYGGLGPTTPFIGHPDASALRAAKNAALVVSTRAELADLGSKYHMALNQLTAQGNHIQGLLLAVAELKRQMMDVVNLTVLNNDAFSAHIAQTHTDGFFLKTKR